MSVTSKSNQQKTMANKQLTKVESTAAKKKCQEVDAGYVVEKRSDKNKQKMLKEANEAKGTI